MLHCHGLHHGTDLVQRIANRLTHVLHFDQPGSQISLEIQRRDFPMYYKVLSTHADVQGPVL